MLADLASIDDMSTVPTASRACGLSKLHSSSSAWQRADCLHVRFYWLLWSLRLVQLWRSCRVPCLAAFPAHVGWCALSLVCRELQFGVEAEGAQGLLKLDCRHMPLWAASAAWMFRAKVQAFILAGILRLLMAHNNYHVDQVLKPASACVLQCWTTIELQLHSVHWCLHPSFHIWHHTAVTSLASELSFKVVIGIGICGFSCWQWWGLNEHVGGLHMNACKGASLVVLWWWSLRAGPQPMFLQALHRAWRKDIVRLSTVPRSIRKVNWLAATLSTKISPLQD